MKTENLMLITDARAVLLNTAVTDAKQNPLVAAFLGWLLRRDDLLALLGEAATRAAAAKGAERNSRNVAVLGFACGVETLKTCFAAEFSAQLEWSIGRPNFATGGEPCGVVAEAFPPRLVVPLQQLLEKLFHFAFTIALANDADARRRGCETLLAVWPEFKDSALGVVQRGLVERPVEDIERLWCLVDNRKPFSFCIKVRQHRCFKSGKQAERLCSKAVLDAR